MEHSTLTVINFVFWPLAAFLIFLLLLLLIAIYVFLFTEEGISSYTGVHSIFYPTFTYRQNKMNFLMIISLTVEFFALMSFAFHPTIKFPSFLQQLQTFFQFFVFLYPSTSYIITFGIVMVFTVCWSMYAGVTFFTTLIREQAKCNFYIVTIISDTLFLSILRGMLAGLDCILYKSDFDYCVGLDNYKMNLVALFLILGIALFVLTATFVGPIFSMQKYTDERLDIQYVGGFVMLERTLKAILCIIVTLFASIAYVRISLTLSIVLLLFISNVMVQPCCVKMINLLRSTSYFVVVWSTIITYTIQANIQTTYIGPILMLAGWVTIIVCMIIFYYKTKDSVYESIPKSEIYRMEWHIDEWYRFNIAYTTLDSISMTRLSY